MAGAASHSEAGLAPIKATAPANERATKGTSKVQREVMARPMRPRRMLMRALSEFGRNIAVCELASGKGKGRSGGKRIGKGLLAEESCVVQRDL